MNSLIIGILIIIIIACIIAISVYFNADSFANDPTLPFGFRPPPFKTRVQAFTNSQKFRAPISLTSLKDFSVAKPREASKTKVKTVGNYDEYISGIIRNYNKGRTEETEKRTIYDILHDIAHHDIVGFHSKHASPKNLPKNHLHYEKGNLLTMPTFFDCRDKWPGCIPAANYQGTCGSCWAFAICTCLSARLYIESCGYGGCNSYPQLNLKSVDLTENNIDAVYKYKTITLSNIHKFINIGPPEKNPSVTLDEWLSAVKRAHKIVLSDSTTGLDRFQAMQTIVYLLDFQSLGSIKFNKKRENLDELLYRAKKVFNYSADEKGKIYILDWQAQWLSQPIPLSPEKLISCCYPNCYERDQFDVELTREEIIKKGTPQCVGSSLIDGWKVVRSVGTTSTICIGYNLDSWEEGDFTPDCHELQGPNYEYCSGFALTLGLWGNDIKKQLQKYEQEKLNPINENNPLVNKIPWVYPQTFKFFAKNAYEVNNNVTDIQNEIIQRGPVTTGFVIYSDFQDEFGSSGMGGQLYKPGTTPLGSTRNSLIYMWNGKGKPIGGHAITIVGWGTFKESSGHFIPYWICLNSWGREWGTNGYPSKEQRESYPAKLDGGGYFWMVRGIDNCSIEKNVCAGQPNMGNLSYPGTIEKYGWGLPYPELSNISLIPGERELKTPDITVKFGDLVDGGGVYVKNAGPEKWDILAMDPPSPFVLFWPEERPVYCLGKITKRVSILDQDIYIDNDAFLKLRMVMQFCQSPILVINDEQVQIIDNSVFMTRVKTTRQQSAEPKKFRVNRGLNRSKPQSHNVGSFIKIFPYKDLSIAQIEKMNFKRCENVFLGTITETSNLVEVCNKLDYSKRLLGS
jgi:hypothetical protein